MSAVDLGENNDHSRVDHQSIHDDRGPSEAPTISALLQGLISSLDSLDGIPNDIELKYVEARCRFSYEGAGDNLDSFLKPATCQRLENLTPNFKRTKSLRAALRASEWALQDHDIWRHFGTQQLLSVKFLESLKRFLAKEQDFSIALHDSTTARDSRRGGQRKAQGVRNALWQPSDIEAGMKIWEARRDQQAPAAAPANEELMTVFDEAPLPATVNTLKRKRPTSKIDKHRMLSVSSPEHRRSPLTERSPSSNNIEVQRSNNSRAYLATPIPTSLKTQYEENEAEADTPNDDDEFEVECGRYKDVELADVSSDDGDDGFQMMVDDDNTQLHKKIASKSDSEIAGSDEGHFKQGPHFDAGGADCSNTIQATDASNLRTASMPLILPDSLGSQIAADVEQVARRAAVDACLTMPSEDMTIAALNTAAQPLVTQTQNNAVSADVSPSPRISGLNLERIRTCLQPHEWLVSDAIDIPLQIIQSCSTLVLDSSFIATNYPNVVFSRKPVLRRLVETVEVIVAPLNHGNTHWTLAVVNLGTGLVQHFDSLRDLRHLNEAKEGLIAFQHYLQAHYSWLKDLSFNIKSEECAQQINMTDCGVHTVITAIRSSVNPASVALPIDCTLWRQLLLAYIECGETVSPVLLGAETTAKDVEVVASDIAKCSSLREISKIQQNSNDELVSTVAGIEATRRAISAVEDAESLFRMFINSIERTQHMADEEATCSSQKKGLQQYDAWIETQQSSIGTCTEPSLRAMLDRHLVEARLERRDKATVLAPLEGKLQRRRMQGDGLAAALKLATVKLRELTALQAQQRRSINDLLQLDKEISTKTHKLIAELLA